MRKDKSNIIYKKIKRDILKGELKSGDVIPSERELMQIFNMSRTPIRKALDELERENLIIRRIGDGDVYKRQSLDTYSSMGPSILHKTALPFPIEVDVKSYVNNELRQSSNTKLFLADIPQIISEISAGITLEPGDIIITGTPSGVGMGMKPQGFMKKGDIVTCEIPEIGKLINTIE